MHLIEKNYIIVKVRETNKQNNEDKMKTLDFELSVLAKHFSAEVAIRKAKRNHLNRIDDLIDESAKRLGLI